MSDVVNSITTAEKPRPRTNELRRIFKVMFGRWVVTGGAVVILILIIIAIFAPLLAPYDPDTTDLKAILAQPSSQHLLGTDEVGRDVLSRVIYGSRISLLVGIVGVSIAGVIGIALGLLALVDRGFRREVKALAGAGIALAATMKRNIFSHQ